MLINLSDVLSDQHKTVEETVGDCTAHDGYNPSEIRRLSGCRK